MRALLKVFSLLSIPLSLKVTKLQARRQVELFELQFHCLSTSLVLEFGLVFVKSGHFGVRRLAAALERASSLARRQAAAARAAGARTGIEAPGEAVSPKPPLAHASSPRRRPL
jgi:hypothetical protein